MSIGISFTLYSSVISSTIFACPSRFAMSRADSPKKKIGFIWFFQLGPTPALKVANGSQEVLWWTPIVYHLQNRYPKLFDLRSQYHITSNHQYMWKQNYLKPPLAGPFANMVGRSAGYYWQPLKGVSLYLAITASIHVCLGLKFAPFGFADIRQGWEGIYSFIYLFTNFLVGWII